ncbi:hypothetical protein [Flavobacterium sp. AG291]|uniref:hypothetical protein n=1 Tax=Flavobacterium sp. AG291 TaxID=2184000 RepID=UPI000E0A8736|nr:hypothetical protein [Flavobacterium sp. AG291]RDI12136.1 hypothetical protein DEU42_10468 [Flavobacterium sp. AG291]
MITYASTSDYGFMYKNQQDFSDFQSTLDELDIPIDSSNILGLVFYTKNVNYDIENNYNISSNDITGCLLYEIRNNTVYSLVYTKYDNHFSKTNNLSDLKTNIISSNDIYSVSRLILNENQVTAISFINFSRLPKNVSYEKFQEVLDIEMINISESSVQCSPPCIYNTKDQRCTAQEGQHGPEK